MAKGNGETEEKFDLVSMTGGYWYAFEDEGNEITVNISSWSGMGRMFINDELVFEGRSFGIFARHRISHDGKDYDLRVCTVRFLTSDVEVMLTSGDRIIGVKTMSYYGGSLVQILKNISPLLIFAALAIVLGIWFDFSFRDVLVVPYQAGYSVGQWARAVGPFSIGIGLGVIIAILIGVFAARRKTRQDKS
ncbi:MAG: hypothetical protein JKY60_10140 [Kordiimonadaceae bacterium]|nr:hypothetical protein [Kordiimonadaceae bacterium]